MIEKYSNFNPEFKAIICNNIKVYRKEKGVRLMDLAEILDVSPEYLKRIESPNDTKKNCIKDISVPLNPIHLNNPLSPEYLQLIIHFP